MKDVRSIVGKIARCIKQELYGSSWSIQDTNGDEYKVLVPSGKDAFKNYRIQFTPEGSYLINLDAR